MCLYKMDFDSFGLKKRTIIIQKFQYIINL